MMTLDTINSAFVLVWTQVSSLPIFWKVGVNFLAAECCSDCDASMVAVHKPFDSRYIDLLTGCPLIYWRGIMTLHVLKVILRHGTWEVAFMKLSTCLGILADCRLIIVCHVWPLLDMYKLVVYKIINCWLIMSATPALCIRIFIWAGGVLF